MPTSDETSPEQSLCSGIQTWKMGSKDDQMQGNYIGLDPEKKTNAMKVRGALMIPGMENTNWAQLITVSMGKLKGIK